MLDVGCSGRLLPRARGARGWDCVGIEPSEQAAAHARGMGVEVVEQFLDDVRWGELGTFDAIHLKLVLEHLGDPAGVLSAVRACLKPGGIVCVQAMHDYWLAKRGGRRWAGAAVVGRAAVS